MENVEQRKALAKHSILSNQSYLVTELLKSECFPDFSVDNITNFDHKRDIYEYRLVTTYMANKLRDKGEMLLENDYGHWWCRTTTGQQAFVDNVINEIAKDLV